MGGDEVQTITSYRWPILEEALRDRRQRFSFPVRRTCPEKPRRARSLGDEDDGLAAIIDELAVVIDGDAVSVSEFL